MKLLARTSHRCLVTEKVFLRLRSLFVFVVFPPHHRQRVERGGPFNPLLMIHQKRKQERRSALFIYIAVKPRKECPKLHRLLSTHWTRFLLNCHQLSFYSVPICLLEPILRKMCNAAHFWRFGGKKKAKATWRSSLVLVERFSRHWK